MIVTFKYKGWLDSTWSHNGATHQMDPLCTVLHENQMVPLYEVIGISRDQAIALATPHRLHQVREERNRLLAETDWWVLSDRQPTQSQLSYRQALRDITENFDPTAELEFPAKPE